MLAYAFDWTTVNVLTGANCRSRTTVPVGTVAKGKERSVIKDITFEGNYRGYWQIKFSFENKRYMLNKNNAQANPWMADNGEMPEITLRWEDEGKIRADFVLRSGNAYFNCSSC